MLEICGKIIWYFYIFCLKIKGFDILMKKKRFYRNFDFIIYNTINIEIDVICIYCFLNGCMILIYLQIANPYF